jgi:hypothetical protein
VKVLSNRAGPRHDLMAAPTRSFAQENRHQAEALRSGALRISFSKKGKRVAAEALEAAEADIRFEDGRFIVAGTDRAIDLLRVLALARQAGDPLDTYYAGPTSG